MFVESSTTVHRKLGSDLPFSGGRVPGLHTMPHMCLELLMIKLLCRRLCYGCCFSGQIGGDAKTVGDDMVVVGTNDM